MTKPRSIVPGPLGLPPRAYIGPADPNSPAALRARLARFGQLFEGNRGFRQAQTFRESDNLGKAEHLANTGLGIAGAAINAHRGPGSYQHQLNFNVAIRGLLSAITATTAPNLLQAPAPAPARPPRDAPPPYRSFPGGPSIHASPQRRYGSFRDLNRAHDIRPRYSNEEMLARLQRMPKDPTTDAAIALLKSRISAANPAYFELFPEDPHGRGPAPDIKPPARSGREAGPGTELMRAGLWTPTSEIEISKGGVPDAVTNPYSLSGNLSPVLPQPTPRGRAAVLERRLHAFARLGRRYTDEYNAFRTGEAPEEPVSRHEATRAQEFLQEYEHAATDPWPAWRALKAGPPPPIGTAAPTRGKALTGQLVQSPVGPERKVESKEKPRLGEVQEALTRPLFEDVSWERAPANEGRLPFRLWGMPPDEFGVSLPEKTAAVMGHPAFDEYRDRQTGELKLTPEAKAEMFPAGMAASKKGNLYDPHAQPIIPRDLPDRGRLIDIRSPEAGTFFESKPRTVNLDIPLSTADYQAAQALVSGSKSLQALLKAKAGSLHIKGRPNDREREETARAFSQGRLPANTRAVTLLEALNALSPNQHLGTRLLTKLGYQAGHGTHTFKTTYQPPTHRAYLRTFPAPAPRGAQEVSTMAPPPVIDYKGAVDLIRANLPKRAGKDPLKVIHDQGVAYRGISHFNQVRVNKDGSLTLMPASNMEGRQVGISFSPYIDVATDYGSRVPGEPGQRRPPLAVIAVDKTALPELYTQSYDEVEVQGNRPITIPKGKWSQSGKRLVDSGTELREWEHKTQAEWNRKSPREIIRHLVSSMERSEQAEYEGRYEVDPTARAADQLTASIFSKYGDVTTEAPFAAQALLNQINNKPPSERRGFIAQLLRIDKSERGEFGGLVGSLHGGTRRPADQLIKELETYARRINR